MEPVPVLACLLAAFLKGVPEDVRVPPLPMGRSYQSLVITVPYIPTVYTDQPFQIEGVVVSPEAEPAPQYQPTPAFSELYSGCPRFGMFILRLTVTATGAVTKPRIVRGSGCAAADQRILEATRSWRFWPARKKGQAVSARITLSLNVDG
jgi:TonB family protein